MWTGPWGRPRGPSAPRRVSPCSAKRTCAADPRSLGAGRAETLKDGDASETQARSEELQQHGDNRHNYEHVDNAREGQPEVERRQDLTLGVQDAPGDAEQHDRRERY